MSKVNINNILPTASVFNTERFDNIISKRFFYSGTSDSNNPSDLIFNQSFYVYEWHLSLGFPIAGVCMAFSWSNYGDAPSVSAGCQLLVGTGTNKGRFFIREIAGVNNGGNSDWFELITSNNIGRYISGGGKTRRISVLQSFNHFKGERRVA